MATQGSFEKSRNEIGVQMSSSEFHKKKSFRDPITEIYNKSIERAQ